MVHCTEVRAVLTSRLTVSGFDLAWFRGFDLAWFSSLSSEHLCVFGVLGAVYIVISFAYILLFTFLVS